MTNLPPSAPVPSPKVAALALAAALLAVPSFAQSAPEPKDDVVTLSRFDVVAAKDESYGVTQATAGLKTRQALIDVAGAVQVMPRTMIEDLGYFAYPSDFAKYAASGVASFGGNNLYYMRGERLTRTFKNGIEYFPSIDDDVTTETIEIVKGAQAVLFGTRPVTQGMILRTTKVPLYSARNTIRAIMDEHGFLRAELDSTGPLAKSVAGARAAYRVVGAWQDGKQFQGDLFDDRIVFSPSVQLDWRNTTLRTRYEYSQIKTSGLFANNFLDQTNRISTISGRSQGYKAPWSNSRFTKHELETVLNHRFSSKFESNLQLAYFSEERSDHDSRLAVNNTVLLGSDGVVDSSDTLRFNLLTLAQMQKMFSVVNDYIAEFDLNGRRQQTNFGWAASSARDEQALLQTPLVSPQTGTTNFPIINPVFGPDPVDPVLPGSANTIQRRDAANVYLMHQSHVLNDRLIATVAGSWSWSDNTSRLDTSTAPLRQSKGDKPLYRFGLVYKPRPDLSFFASRATNFVPSGADDRDPNGSPLPPSTGLVNELGVKSVWLDGRVAGSVIWFRNETANLPVRFNIGTPQLYALPAGKVETEGFEFDLALRPAAGWNIIATLFNGDGPKDQNGARLPRTYKSTYSLMAKYDFQSDALKGFGVGANLFHIGSLTQSGAPDIPGHDVINAFVSYRRGSKWQVNVNVTNVADKLYYAGGNSRFSAQPSVPRTIGLSAKYSF
jgi:outer membrane receptor protein involved in Fe transport